MPTRVQYQRWQQWIVVLAIVIVMFFAWQYEQGVLEAPRLQRPVGELLPGEYTVRRVVDGDTLLLDHKQVRVRLQGIDTPETVKPESPVEPWGPEATAFTRQFIEEAGGQVRLEIDGETVDRHGRHLAFVWHGEHMLNEELVRQGLAEAELTYDYSREKKDLLRAAENEARSANRGIWSD